MHMHIKHCTVSTEACSRYRYAREYVPRLSKKISALIKRCGLNDTFSEEFLDVHIYIITEKNTDLISKNHIINKECKCVCIEIETFTCANSEDFKKRVKGQFFLCVCSFEETQRKDTLIWQYVDQAVLLVHDQDDFSDIRSAESIDNTMVSIKPKSMFADELDIMLERMIFKYLYPKVRILKSFLFLKPASAVFDSMDQTIKNTFCAKLQKKIRQPLERNKETSLYRAWHEARLKVVKTIINKAYGKEDMDIKQQILKLPTICTKRSAENPRALTICEHILPYLDETSRPGLKPVPDLLLMQVSDMQIASDVYRNANEILAKFTENIQRVYNNRDEIEQLYFECAAMYSRSKVPESERPISHQKLLHRLEENVAKEIINVKGVTGCGYRFLILDIYINDKLTEEDKIRSKIELRNIIEKHKIERFVFRDEQNFVPFCFNVGSRIFASHYNATLGGFAKRGNKQTLCILLSRHVSLSTTFISAELDDGKRELIAEVLPQKQVTGPFDVDISVADVIHHFQTKCSKQFRDRYGNPKVSRLVQFEESELDWMSGLPVHIWGAASSPGHGLIICPEYYVSMGGHDISRYVKIEDLCHGDDFAKPGDSGAIVCADDIAGNCVHVISMLMGSFCEGNTAQTNKYLSFRLKDGLFQLREEYGEDFELF